MTQDRNNVGFRFRKVIADHLGIEETEVIGEKTFFSLGADSLDEVELIMAIEEEFNIEIPDVEAAKIKTVGQGIRYLKENM